MNILLLYGSTEGHSRKIAYFMQHHLLDQGHAASVHDVMADPPPPFGFDLVVIGGSLHVMKHQVMLARYVREHCLELSRMPTAFFSVSLGIASGTEKDMTEARRLAGAFLDHVKWTPDRVELVAGAIQCAPCDFFKKRVIRKLGGSSAEEQDPDESREYTDWRRLRSFCDNITNVGAGSYSGVVSSERSVRDAHSTKDAGDRLALRDPGSRNGHVRARSNKSKERR